MNNMVTVIGYLECPKTDALGKGLHDFTHKLIEELHNIPLGIQMSIQVTMEYTPIEDMDQEITALIKAEFG